MIGYSYASFSQNYIAGTLYNVGNAYCSTSLNNAGFFVNATGADLYVTGTISNSGTTGYDGGRLSFVGNSMQTLNGPNVFRTTNALFNNTTGVALTKCLSVNNTCTFVTGVVTTPSGFAEPLEFTSSALATGTSDASHVNGYVRKLGLGPFVYPVGDAVKYQKITIAPTVNATGILVNY